MGTSTLVGGSHPLSVATLGRKTGPLSSTATVDVNVTEVARRPGLSTGTGRVTPSTLAPSRDPDPPGRPHRGTWDGRGTEWGGTRSDQRKEGQK